MDAIIWCGLQIFEKCGPHSTTTQLITKPLNHKGRWFSSITADGYGIAQIRQDVAHKVAAGNAAGAGLSAGSIVVPAGTFPVVRH